jgi:hypothetical protein
MGVLGYIGIRYKEHPPKVWNIPPGDIFYMDKSINWRISDVQGH